MFIRLSRHAETRRAEEMRAAGAVACAAQSEASEVLLATLQTRCER